MKRLIAATAAAVPLVLATCNPVSAATHTPYTVKAALSTYDTENNSPPGAGIEYAKNYGYPTVHNLAGGTGTYANPITFASENGELPPGARIYIAHWKKYFIKEDLCTSCYNPPAWQFDLWVGGVTPQQDANQNPANITNLWTSKYPVIIYPSANEPVDTTPFRKAHT